MPVEYPNTELFEQYRQTMEEKTINEIKSNGYAPREQDIYLSGFRDGFNRARNYFFGLVKIY